MKIGELFFEIGAKNEAFVKNIKEAESASTKFTDNVVNGASNAGNSLLLLGGKIAASIYAVDKFIEGSTNAATSLENMSMQSRISMEDLRAWGMMASNINPEIGGITKGATGLAEFSKQLIAMQTSASAPNIFSNLMGKLGGFEIAGKNAFQVIDALSDKLRTVDDAMAYQLLPDSLKPFLKVIRMTKNERDKFFAENKSKIGEEQLKSLSQADRDIQEIKNKAGTIQDLTNAKISKKLNSEAPPILDQLGDMLLEIKDYNYSDAIGSTIDAIGNPIGDMLLDLKNGDILKAIGLNNSPVQNPINDMAKPVNLIPQNDTDWLSALQNPNQNININTNVTVNTNSYNGEKIGQDIGSGIAKSASKELNQNTLNNAYSNQKKGGY